MKDQKVITAGNKILTHEIQITRTTNTKKHTWPAVILRVLVGAFALVCFFVLLWALRGVK